MDPFLTVYHCSCRKPVVDSLHQLIVAAVEGLRRFAVWHFAIVTVGDLWWIPLCTVQYCRY